VVHLFSPNGKYDSLYMRNYATLKVKDELARLPGVGQIQIFGSGEYAMRVWLDPNKVAARADRLGRGHGDAGAERTGVRRAAWRRAAAERERFPDLH
jgi:hypothetical protein